MKKILFALCFVFALSGLATPSAMAQDMGNETVKSTETDFSRLWKRHKFFRVGYSWAQTANELDPVEKGDFGFFLTNGNTYFVHKKPLWGLVKIGIDAIWADIQVAKYNNGLDKFKWTSDFEVPPSLYDYEDEGEDFNINLGRLGLGFGMGVGPNISVTPFSLTDIKALQPLRASVYFHYDPSLQLYMVANGDEIELSTAYGNMFDFGFNLQYKVLMIGVEGHWGFGSFKPMDFTDLVGEESLGTSRYKRKFANTRLYIGLTF